MNILHLYVIYDQNEDKMPKNQLGNGLVALKILEYLNIYYIKGHTTPFSANSTITQTKLQVHIGSGL